VSNVSVHLNAVHDTPILVFNRQFVWLKNFDRRQIREAVQFYPDWEKSVNQICTSTYVLPEWNTGEENLSDPRIVPKQSRRRYGTESAKRRSDIAARSEV
jgi:hypothetical protein